MEHKIVKQQEGDENNVNLKSKILERIESQKIKPKSKYYFSAKNGTFWLLGGISVLIGAVAFSVMIFSFTNSEADMYRITHDSLMDFLLEIIPYVWLLIFVVFIVVGYENFKMTEHGYKYSFSSIVVISLILNIVGGIILHSIGVSELIEHNLSSRNGIVTSSDFSRRRDWNQPERGTLSGQIVAVNDDDATFVLRDFNNQLWTVSSGYVPSVSLGLISVGGDIRVIGVVKEASSTNRLMIACYVLPWDTNEYVSGISDIRDYLINSNGYERKLSNERNNNCKAVKPYQVIQEMVGAGS